MNIHKNHTPAMAGAALMLGTALLSGCLFGGDGNAPATIDTPIKVTACQDLAPALQKTADSLVVLGTAQLTGDFEYMFSDTVQDWNGFKSRSTAGALQTFDQALKVAPSHCGAMFGKAVASAMMITQDPKLDAFVKKAQAYSDSNGTSNIAAQQVHSGLALVKLSPDQGAAVLLKLSAEMKYFDPPTVVEFQALVESTLMPKLDSTIASMDAALKFDSFAFEFTNKRGMTYQLDHGEIGPLLAGLKVAKAFLTLVAGYQWEVALDGKYGWADTLANIGNQNFSGDLPTNDYDHLRPSQIAALDHLTGLFSTSSSFSKIKPTWKAKVKNIPVLLLSAVEDAQKGLRFAIAEAGKSTGQEHDVYVVGTGMDADVDPADLLEAVDLLERSKKYLTGVVPLTYNKGFRTLKVNFTKLFDMEDIQSKLPYFKFYPYAEWNDTIKADTNWTPYRGYETDREIISRSNINIGNGYAVSVRGNAGFILTDTLNIILSGQYYKRDSLYFDPNPLLATVTPVPGSACMFTFNKEFEPALLPADPGSPPGSMPLYTLKAAKSHGTFKLSGCRENFGDVEYVGYIDATLKGPLYFTNAAGDKTIDLFAMNNQPDLAALKSQIFFRDPTFGGLFPDLTQDNIWDVIQSLRFVEPRTRQVCEEVIDANGMYTYTCHTIKPANPSDLDLFISVTNWMDVVL